jgi:hypothetical protein
MACASRTTGCPGPYTEESCDTCAALEGEKCTRTPPATGKDFKTKQTLTCAGPFADPPAYRCGPCKQIGKFGKPAWLTLVKDRTDKQGWKKTLKKLQVKEVYDGDACVDITPADIDNQYNVDLQAGKAYSWCPWVRIGNLYTTVTTGNDAGWRLLVQNHIQPDATAPRAISVFTGRHGNPEGTITKDDRELFYDGVMDGNHYLQDILQKVVSEGHFASRPPSEQPRIKLWDVGTTAGTTMTRTQQLARERLDKGEIVIFAWCWSLLSFYKVNVKEAAAFKRWHRDQAYNKPIKEIVADKYGWAKAPRKLSIATPAAVKWKASEWRKAVSADRKSTAQIVPKTFPDGLTESQVTDQKETLSNRLEKTLNRPVHNH